MKSIYQLITDNLSLLRLWSAPIFFVQVSCGQMWQRFIMASRPWSYTKPACTFIHLDLFLKFWQLMLIHKKKKNSTQFDTITIYQSFKHCTNWNKIKNKINCNKTNLERNALAFSNIPGSWSLLKSQAQLVDFWHCPYDIIKHNQA